MASVFWLELENQYGLKAFVLEFSDGSSDTGELNWLAIQAASLGTYLGTLVLDSWNIGTECKMISFQHVSLVSLFKSEFF